MRTIPLMSALLLVLLATGCTGYGTYWISSQRPPETDPKSIKVYSVTSPSGNYDVLAYISVYTSDAQDAGDALKRKLREHAAELGANAIIGFKLNQVVSGGGGAEGIAVRFR